MSKVKKYIIANNDRAVPPDLQYKLSQGIGATTVVVESSHAVMFSHPQKVLDVIQTAAANC